MALFLGGRWLTDLSETALLLILFFVGIVVPLMLNNYFDNREAG